MYKGGPQESAFAPRPLTIYYIGLYEWTYFWITCSVYLTTLSADKTIAPNWEMTNEYELKGMWKETTVI
jgi:hypothetical protein